ncbi:MAG: hypothetical protein KDA91_06630 [Planctomycetaceae bacterium]|nr:hypothetical protein [Planctomycetaceae bacterium]
MKYTHKRFCLTAIALLLVLRFVPKTSADEIRQKVPVASVITYLGYEKAIELRNDSTRVVLCPEVGGRVLEYSLNGNNILYISQDERDWKPGKRPASSAGRFDIGPELVIPERRVLWSGEWTGQITGPGSAKLISQPDHSTGVQLERTFTLATDSSRLQCTQTIINVSGETKEWCHWSRTFAVGKGICLIPVTPHSRFPNNYVMYEEGSLINMRPEDSGIRERDGMIEIFQAPRKPKLGFDSTAGLMAYVAPTNLLFVKRFAADRDRVYNEAAGLTVSVWYPDNQMIELEPIGPRESLKPGERASFTEVWWLADLEFPETPSQLDLSQLKIRMESLK